MDCATARQAVEHLCAVCAQTATNKCGSSLRTLRMEEAWHCNMVLGCFRV